MKLSRLASICVLALCAAFAVAPAASAEPLIDVSELNLPESIITAGDAYAIYDEGADTTSVCVLFVSTDVDTTLIFHDLAVNGSQMFLEEFIGRQVVDVTIDESANQAMCIPVAEGDVTEEGLEFSLSSSADQTVVGDRTNLTFPDSYQDVIADLDALGFDVYDAYFTSNQRDDGTLAYDFKVDITPRDDISENPVNLAITGASLVLDNGDEITMGEGDRIRSIKEDDELWLGFTTEDPEIGLGDVQVTAEIDAVRPSTFKTTGKVPAGLRITASPQTWTHDEENQTTEVSSVTLSNTTSKPLNLSMSSAKLLQTSGSSMTDLRLRSKPIQYITVPAKGTIVLSPFATLFDGDLRYGFALAFSATFAQQTPSAVDVKGLKMPKGYTVEPMSFDLLQYDSKTKTTAVSLLLSQVVTASDKALVLAPATLNGKNSPTAVAGGVNLTTAAGRFRFFSLDLGVVKGDARLGQTLKLAGTLAAAAKTKYSNSAQFDDELGLFSVAEKTSPEDWSYDATKKSTTISVVVANDDASSSRIGLCRLVVNVGGKKVSVVKAVTTVKATSSGRVALAVVPGDLRYGGVQVSITGAYTAGGCS